MADKQMYESWRNLAESAIESMFLTREHGIKNGFFTAEDADSYITEYSNELMSKYAAMNAEQLDIEMTRRALSRMLKHLEGE